MSAAHAEDIQKHVRTYMLVFGALAILTVVTVGVSYLHLPTLQAILLAMVIATVKGSLVAAFFMHLISERQAIYWVLGLCAVFFVFLMALPNLTESEMLPWAKHAPAAAHVESPAAAH